MGTLRVDSILTTVFNKPSLDSDLLMGIFLIFMQDDLAPHFRLSSVSSRVFKYANYFAVRFQVVIPFFVI